MSPRALRRKAKADPKPKRRPKPLTQVAALCIDAGSGRVLLITSRDTGRWVLPKGWPMRKRSLSGSALQEAWEEAGVEGVAGKAEIGRYLYDKRRDKGFAIPVEVRVFPILVSGLADRFPEAGQRQRAWLHAEDAATMVDEHELQALILALPEMLAAGPKALLKGR